MCDGPKAVLESDRGILCPAIQGSEFVRNLLNYPIFCGPETARLQSILNVQSCDSATTATINNISDPKCWEAGVMLDSVISPEKGCARADPEGFNIQRKVLYL